MGKMNRRAFLDRLAGAAAAMALPRCVSGPGMFVKGRRPNIVFIMADDHAAHALSCYGSKINRTPNLDRIAKEGMRFTNCFCTNSICAPSRAAILTGKYSHLNGQFTNKDIFDGTQQTFPKLLQEAGYQMAVVGKWHLRSDPTGFDYWNVLPGQGDYQNPDLIEMGETKAFEGYVTDIITDIAIDFVRNRATDKPFCLLYHHKAPHRRWIPDAKHAHMYESEDIPEPVTFDDDYAGRASAAGEATMRIDEHLDARDLKKDPPPGLSPEALKKWKYQRYMQDYLRVVASVDDNVGRFLDHLDENGLAEDTIVIYTSDQGFFLGDHGWFDKRFMYEESLRMPLLVRYPQEIQPGTVNDALVLNLDFAPTFADYACATIPADMQGRSIRPLLQGDTPVDWRTSMYYHYYEYPRSHNAQPHFGVRTRRYKLIYYYQTDEWELFDLKRDPYEVNNVYGDLAYINVVIELKAELDRLRRDLKDT